MMDIKLHFLILIVFIYAFLSMTVHRGFWVDLPQAVSGKLEKTEYVGITVEKDGAIYFDKELVSIEELSIKVDEVSAKGSDKARVYINADKDATHGNVVRVLEAVKNSGIKQVAIEVERSGGVQ